MEESRLMKYEIDENGYIIKGYEPDAKDIPDGVVDAWEGSGFFKPRYDREKRQWVEGATQEEIDEILKGTNPIDEPVSEVEQMKEQILNLQRMCNVLMANQP
ncbi:hypothetical protein ACTOTM_00065 [Bacillus subtilis]|uniref:Uncharacterized protein n=1 Tax=Bacillus subtilis TaxID=1423 RepID=A0AC61Z5T8_BACIU|nr:hypothetical protein [Bacillus subtilis]MDH3120135.1 hypothetical protein [Bacillus subtilis]MEC0312987.1 hypothetical protein [Bacillus subtilis]MEC0361289.1 hypothetical protein [Bacillus subtilis]MED3603739.1 hypothetical protein [Bacillus subtilis]MED3672089.1 hypothetical protein [Bacillus subtilis]